MQRIPEPAELMDDASQAQAYAAADFDEPHSEFVQRFTQCFPEHRPLRVLEPGCGTADISWRFAQAYPACHIDGFDGADAMLAVGRNLLREKQLQQRISLSQHYLPDNGLPTNSYDTVICNALLHHLLEPLVLWQCIQQCAQPSAAVFVMDLSRPDSRDDAQHIIDTYAANEAPQLQEDFYNSLCAAYTPAEVRKQLDACQLQHLQVEKISDRHLLIHGIL